MKSESAAGRSSGNDDALRAEEDVMTVQELIDKQIFGVVNLGDSLDRQITVPFCCDLLSIVMGRAKAYEAIVKGDNLPKPGIPEAMNVLLHELRGLALSVKLE